MNNELKRLIEINQYNPSKGKVNEGFWDVDTKGWICVGEVPFYPWQGDKDKVYIMVNPQKTMKWGKEIREVRYTENPDGSGKQADSIPNFAKESQIIYPQHQDDEYGEMFLGKRKDNAIIEQEHKAFMSKLFIIGNNVVLHHNSSYVIKDGFVKKGEANGYSNNSDIGIYFWGSRNSGNDPSNSGGYTYYCLIPREELYDFSTNPERMTLRNALRKYNYCGQYWQDSDAIVVNTFKPTSIWCILDKSNGKWFDKEWNEIEKPFN